MVKTSALAWEDGRHCPKNVIGKASAETTATVDLLHVNFRGLQLPKDQSSPQVPIFLAEQPSNPEPHGSDLEAYTVDNLSFPEKNTYSRSPSPIQHHKRLTLSITASTYDEANIPLVGGIRDDCLRWKYEAEFAEGTVTTQGGLGYSGGTWKNDMRIGEGGL
ncbi:uncharacterized protein LAJ45_07753 [Morchella importuna]|uniref:uncharacterized protein n=1 Tax=Morchella importuna TaxID=1174673 RepID=UPI001E8E85C7|nr:uncharacterized protein LAJ45_07753 [Morchella importuna]KAH8148300.1 hypothetical protein LAJ45_07753 [Morchella importuna]